MTALDTSVIIAALSSWHEAHEAAAAAVERALELGAVLPLPALHESYSVLTRLPPPHRVSPRQAAAMLASLDPVTLVALPATWSDLADWAESGVAGGQVYDARIVACAVRAGADTVLTFNLGHFERLAGPSVQVRAPT